MLKSISFLLSINLLLFDVAVSFQTSSFVSSRPVTTERTTTTRKTIKPLQYQDDTATTISDVVTSTNNNSSYLRWKKDGDSGKWSMETAVTTFKRGNQIVELHAQVHFADHGDYYNYYNSDEFNNNFEYVLFELLVDDDLLQYRDGNWRLKQSIQASPNDFNLAKQYSWDCQASSIDYTQSSKWVHADLSRQEFIKLTQAREQETANSNNQPLWQLAGSAGSGLLQPSSPAAEAVSALFVGPPTLSYGSSRANELRRRLFTNLFLPGQKLANLLRAVLWMTVPSPELSIILLDWSSLLEGGSNPNALSKVALPILSSMVKLDLPQIRRFLFGQVLISSNNNNNEKSRVNDQSRDDAWSILVTKRNDHALDVLMTTLDNASDENQKEKVSSTSTPSPPAAAAAALLYGSSHCPDLHTKLRASGFIPLKTTWRTAWSVTENSDQEDTSLIPAILALSALYLGVGACDWVATIGDVSQGFVENKSADSAAAIGLYLIRHVLLYLGLSKFLIDWTNHNNSVD